MGKHDIGALHPDRGLSGSLGYDPEVARMSFIQECAEARLECTEEAYLKDMRRQLCTSGGISTETEGSL